MDKDGHNRNRLSHTSAPMYFAKSKKPVPADPEGAGTTNRLPQGQQPVPRRQRSLHGKGYTAQPWCYTVCVYMYTQYVQHADGETVFDDNKACQLIEKGQRYLWFGAIMQFDFLLLCRNSCSQTLKCSNCGDQTRNYCTKVCNSRNLQVNN